MVQKVLAGLVALAAAVGLAFASVSTSDFVAHLDRQVHGIHCSFLPGVGAADVSGTTGCHVTLMSPYSSVLRESVWGGIPISLPAMAVFAYLVLVPLALIVLGRTEDRRATGFLLAATALPLGTSMVMGWISLRELDALCKLCIGIYVASALAFGFALALFVRALRAASPSAGALRERMMAPRRIAPRAKQLDTSAETLDASAETLDAPLGEAMPADATVLDPIAFGHAPTLDPTGADTLQDAPPLALDPRAMRRLATSTDVERRMAGVPPREAAPAEVSWLALAGAFLLGVAFVALPVAAYAANAPDFERYLGACGSLPSPADPHHVLVPLGPQTGAVQVTEVLDPLCPACRGFEQRFSRLEVAREVSRRALLFPLDDACNWMVDRAIHPGACAISEAVLCAESDADEVLAWAFAEQDAIREATARDPGAAARLAGERFPSLRSCIGSPTVRARLNRALRWAVANQLPVLTPQVYVGGTRVCDADTDLGLDWALTRLVDRSGR